MRFIRPSNYFCNLNLPRKRKLYSDLTVHLSKKVVISTPHERSSSSALDRHCPQTAALASTGAILSTHIQLMTYSRRGRRLSGRVPRLPDVGGSSSVVVAQSAG